jgi:hypothetical protein
MKFLIILLISFNIYAQYLDIDAQIKIGTGLTAISWNQEVGFRRSYTNIMIDTSFIIDKDRTFQYGFSIDIDLETKLSFTPGIYLKFEKSIKNNLSIFAVSGITYMISPDTIFGFRIGFGANYMLLDYLGFIFQLDIEPLLFGSGLNDRMLTEIKTLFGINFLF